MFLSVPEVSEFVPDFFFQWQVWILRKKILKMILFGWFLPESLLTFVQNWCNLKIYFCRTFQRVLELFPVPDTGHRWTLIGLAAFNALLCIFLEDVVIEIGVQKFWKKYGFTTKTRYNEIGKTLRHKHSLWWTFLALKSIYFHRVLAPISSGMADFVSTKLAKYWKIARLQSGIRWKILSFHRGSHPGARKRSDFASSGSGTQARRLQSGSWQCSFGTKFQFFGC